MAITIENKIDPSDFPTLADDIEIEECQTDNPSGDNPPADQLTEIPIIKRNLKSSKKQDSRSNIFSQGN